MRLRAWRKTKVLPSGIQVGCPAPPRPPPPRPPALRVSSVIGCFWAKAEAARRRRMLNFVMVAIVAIRGGRLIAEGRRGSMPPRMGAWQPGRLLHGRKSAEKGKNKMHKAEPY